MDAISERLREYRGISRAEKEEAADTIDALVAALDLTVDVLDSMRRAGCIHTDASEEDFYSYFVGPGVFENARRRTCACARREVMEPRAKLELTFDGRGQRSDVQSLILAFSAAEPVERFGKQWIVYQIEQEMLRTVVTLHMLHS